MLRPSLWKMVQSFLMLELDQKGGSGSEPLNPNGPENQSSNGVFGERKGWTNCRPPSIQGDFVLLLLKATQQHVREGRCSVMTSSKGGPQGQNKAGDISAHSLGTYSISQVLVLPVWPGSDRTETRRNADAPPFNQNPPTKVSPCVGGPSGPLHMEKLGLGWTPTAAGMKQTVELQKTSAVIKGGFWETFSLH